MSEVTQQDREAAAEYLVAIIPTFPNLAERVQETGSAIVRSFAAHAEAEALRAVKLALERAARRAYVACAEARHVSLAQKSEAAILTLDAAAIVKESRDTPR